MNGGTAMPTEVSSNQFYRLDFSLLGADLGGLTNLNVANDLDQVSGTINDQNGVISSGAEANATFTQDGGEPTELTFLGAGTISLVSFLGIELFPREVMLFEAGGEVFLFAPDGLPPLSSTQFSLNLDANAEFVLESGPDGTVDGLETGEVMGLGYTDRQGDQITNGADTIFGNGGDDVILSAGGDDFVYGGDGDDTITGGAGADSLFGDQGSDVFIGGNDGDVIIGGEDADGTDVDTLDLTGTNVATINYSDDTRENGTVVFDDGTSLVFSEIENVIPCFTTGSQVATPKGLVAVENLKQGDLVITRDNGIQPIAWTGHRSLSRADLEKDHKLRPILIPKGALGEQQPDRDIMVSPNHRLLLSGGDVEMLFGEHEVFAAAKFLVGLRGIKQAAPMTVSYVHFMCERHEVVCTDSFWSESFQPGDYSLGGVDAAQRSELLQLFPDLMTKSGRLAYKTARLDLKRFEAQSLGLCSF